MDKFRPSQPTAPLLIAAITVIKNCLIGIGSRKLAIAIKHKKQKSVINAKLKNRLSTIFEPSEIYRISSFSSLLTALMGDFCKVNTKINDKTIKIMGIRPVINSCNKICSD